MYVLWSNWTDWIRFVICIHDVNYVNWIKCWIKNDFAAAILHFWTTLEISPIMKQNEKYTLFKNCKIHKFSLLWKTCTYVNFCERHLKVKPLYSCTNMPFFGLFVQVDEYLPWGIGQYPRSAPTNSNGDLPLPRLSVASPWCCYMQHSWTSATVASKVPSKKWSFWGPFLLMWPPIAKTLWCCNMQCNTAGPLLWSCLSKVADILYWLHQKYSVINKSKFCNWLAGQSIFQIFFGSPCFRGKDAFIKCIALMTAIARYQEFAK